jgi:hypothetical protein
LAQEEDLLVLLRPGPYICAERDMVWVATIIGSKGNNMVWTVTVFSWKRTVDFQNIYSWLLQNNYSALFEIFSTGHAIYIWSETPVGSETEQ